MLKKSFFEKYEFIIPLALFILFLIFTLPGISWGAPSVWHPDEIVVRSIKALHGEWQFSEINFDYPDLPQYAMFWLGKIILALGQTDKEVLIASRVLSAILAGLTVVLTYIITRRTGGNIQVASLSGLLLICVSAMEHNGHFAHNDTYVMFFATLSILFLIEYFFKRHNVWLYATFILVGMAASSKYIGGSLFIAPVLVYLVLQRKNLWQESFAIVETLFIGTVLTFLGFAFGTPKALFWMSFYFKRVFAALQFQVGYGRQPDSVRGIIGQYHLLADGFGLALVLLFGAALLWACWYIAKNNQTNEVGQASRSGVFAILLLAILVLDLPIMISYLYQLRFFLTMMPPLAVLAAFFVEDLYMQAKQGGKFHSALVSAGVALIVIYSIARIVSMMLMFVHDARIPASAFVNTLPIGSSLEHTLYPPTVPSEHFEREHNYPIYFRKAVDEPLPTNKNYKFNVGEIGLVQRKTDYFVVDSFTTDKFNNPYTCKIMQAECDFFKQLATGQSAHYKLIAEFSYTLPAYLPQIEVTFVNPSIRIYERIK